MSSVFIFMFTSNTWKAIDRSIQLRGYQQDLVHINAGEGLRACSAELGPAGSGTLSCQPRDPPPERFSHAT